MNPIEIYTDGACKGNPGPGGWGVLLKSGGTEKELFGGEAQTTNNRMELLAVIEAPLEAARPCAVTLYLDSEYVRKGITEWIQRLEGAWLAHGRQAAGEERRPLATAGRGGQYQRPCDRLALGQGACR